MSRSLSKFTKTGAHEYSLQRIKTLLLGQTKTEGPKAGKSRGKLDFLSLESDFPLHCTYSAEMPRELFFSLLFYSSCVPSLPHVKPSLAYLGYTHPLSIYHGFSSNGIMPCVHVGPTLDLRLTHSTPDTWHTMSHSKCAKCLHYARCLKKRANSDCLGIQ